MMCATQLSAQMAGANAPAWNAPAASAGKETASDTSVSFQTLLRQRQNYAAENESTGGEGENLSGQSGTEDPLPREQETKDAQAVSMDLAALGEALLAGSLYPIQTETCGMVQPQETAQSVSVEEILSGDAASANAPSVLEPEQMELPQTMQQFPAAEQDASVTEQTVPAAQMQIPENPIQEPAPSAGQDDGVMFLQDQQSGKPTRQEDIPQATDRVVGWEAPLFGQTEQMPVKVGEAVTVDTTAPAPELEQNLGNALKSGLEDGAQRLKIQLSPANLGTVTAEFIRSPEGVLHVVLRAENPEAAKLLGDHAGALGMLLQDSTRGEVHVNVPQPQQEQQLWQQPDQEGGRQQQQQQQQRNAPRQETESFLHQLRLGLVEAGTEEIM